MRERLTSALAAIKNNLNPMNWYAYALAKAEQFSNSQRWQKFKADTADVANKYNPMHFGSAVAAKFMGFVNSDTVQRANPMPAARENAANISTRFQRGLHVAKAARKTTNDIAGAILTILISLRDMVLFAHNVHPSQIGPLPQADAAADNAQPTQENAVAEQAPARIRVKLVKPKMSWTNALIVFLVTYLFANYFRSAFAAQAPSLQNDTSNPFAKPADVSIIMDNKLFRCSQVPGAVLFTDLNKSAKTTYEDSNPIVEQSQAECPATVYGTDRQTPKPF